MTAAAESAAIPTPRHRAPEEALPVRVTAAAERTHTGRHAAPEDDDLAGTDEDPLAWLGFRFEPA